ncbi:hypothetical protein O9992_05250 [Vibrio lentus]|nr:hypothetical protein [Vibrio lentus]
MSEDNPSLSPQLLSDDAMTRKGLGLKYIRQHFVVNPNKWSAESPCFPISLRNGVVTQSTR